MASITEPIVWRRDNMAYKDEVIRLAVDRVKGLLKEPATKSIADERLFFVLGRRGYGVAAALHVEVRQRLLQDSWD